MSTARSYLYVPADREELVQKAGTRGADALILDLEDAVVPARREAARQAVQTVMQDGLPGAPSIWVRVNPTGSTTHGQLDGPIVDDLDAVVRGCLAGVVVAKCESATALRETVLRVRALAAQRGLRTQPGVVALIESARGLEECKTMARTEGLTRLQLGEADLAASLGLDVSDDEHELVYARSRLVLAAAAAGLAPPVASVFRDVRDLGGLRASTERLRRLGFVGRAVVHPAQVAVVHDVFTPTAAALAKAERILTLFNEASRTGRGAVLDEDGAMVDEAVAKAARRVLDLAPPR